MNEQLLNRVKSFLWRAGMMGVAAVVAYTLDNLDTLQLPPLATVFLGLALGEVSKWLNTRPA